MDEYQEFRAYQVFDDGEHSELPASIDKLSDYLTSESVLLLVRYDLRRVFIWKGPRSPVRRRFISSRVGSKIQEENAKTGMHLKIVSVDAGDEPIEFLNAFNISSYDVKEDEKLEDMYYLRNDERKKLEDAKIAQDSPNVKITEPSQPQVEYESPVLKQHDMRTEQMQKSKEKALETVHEISSSIAGTTSLTKPVPKIEKSGSTSKGTKHTTEGGQLRMTQEEEKSILDLLLTQDLQSGWKRINVIIGTSLYSPIRTISTFFGKNVEDNQWGRVGEIPDGNIDIESNLLRVYCKNNQVQALEILARSDASENEGSMSKAQRKLNPIPKGTDET